MGTSLGGALRRLRMAAAVQTLGGLSDPELLARFVAEHDEDAFTVLIERHGPMVLGVCRRALPNRHDAEDACQATFLVLARRADSLRKRASLGSWLHGVARRVAAALKRGAARRDARERRAEPPAPPDPAAEVTWREVQSALDEELGRLPERYRAPLVLCYLECLTRDEAARRLGLTPGGLHGRLERGRGLLHERLTRRGLTLPAAMSAVALGEGVAGAAPPATLVVSSTRAAVLLASGQPLAEGCVAAHVLALTREVLNSMYFAKVTAGALCAAVLALAGGSFVSLGLAQGTKPTPPETLAKAESDKEFIRRLSKELRGSDPTPAEVHFFAASKDAGKRQKLIDLFVKERQAKKDAAGAALSLILADNLQRVDATAVEILLDVSRDRAVDLGALQKTFYSRLQSANGKAEVATITQSYLDGLIGFLKSHPASPDAPAAIRQVILLYESQGKTVEADAWRAKLPKSAR